MADGLRDTWPTERTLPHVPARRSRPERHRRQRSHLGALPAAIREAYQVVLIEPPAASVALACPDAERRLVTARCNAGTTSALLDAAPEFAPDKSAKSANHVAMDSGHVSVRHVASEFGVTPQSVRNWIHAGELEAIQTPGRTYRILRSSVDALRQRRARSVEMATVPNLPVGHDHPNPLLTTGQAARILGTTSRHVIDLCDRGELPYTLAGAHRRLRLSDVAAFRDRRALSRGGPLTEDQQRALWLGYALAARVAVDPMNVLERARQRALKALASNPAGARWLRDWLRLIDQGPDAVMRALVSTSPQSRELRQNLPFAGELSEAERARLITAFRTANPRG